MKAIKIIFGLTVIGAVLTFSRFLFSNAGRHSQPAEKTARGSIEEVVYMSDIDGLVKAVMLMKSSSILGMHTMLCIIPSVKVMITS